ncbi:MAG: hypothetical protein H7Y42_19845 [Chitinophagaceae bacterium]|nr:hypothetical protein [Chitinophagaceae bacterium]
MKISVLLLFLLIASKSNSQALSIPRSDLADGYYRGHSFMMAGYVRVSNDTAIADFIQLDKMPRDLHTDTLFYDAVEETWKGKTARLYKKGRTWRIENEMPWFAARMKIKEDEKVYKSQINIQKNLALERKGYEEYFKEKGSTVEATQQYGAVRKKFDIYQLATTLTHAEFLVEYAKFKAALRE